MGVHGLWELLAPVGRRVSVETLAGKTLAVDASIWMVQFIKAMRDEKGEMVRNAHLLGFFRRICKLLFLRTKPVFVFDGGTPALKRRTVIARRRNRENAQAKVRKTAEKLLLNHLKALRLKELADDIKSQRMKHNSDKGQKKSNKKDFVGGDLGGSHVKEPGEMSASKEDRNSLHATVSTSFNQEELDEMLAASIAAEENGIHARKGMPSVVISPSEEGRDADEEIILPSASEEVDIAVLAALPQSIQLDILAQLKGKKKEGLVKEADNQKENEVIYWGKGKGILPGETDMIGCSSGPDNVTSRSDNQGTRDEMLAASIAVEEHEELVNNASTSVGASTIEEEEDDYDEDEEMILPAMHGEVDPAVLASLPPSMQLDLLVQMRERLMAENRQKYQKVKKDPAKFSELQIQAYLKTVAFRREIDEVQKAAAGGVGGIQTSRIASEANREYIFSSSFTGDKQELTTTRLENNKDTQQKAQGADPSQNLAHRILAGNDSNTSTGLVSNGGVGGIQTSRIASEANREYIFSSSFTGDKQELTTTRLENNKDTQQKAQGADPSQNLAHRILAGNDSNTSTGLVSNGPSEPSDESIETYLDERGRFRVSRLRAMGMRMTRDIQRNLDLMKEIEQERAHVNKAANNGTEKNVENNGSSESSRIQLVDKSEEVNVDLVRENVQNEQTMLDRDTSIDISFEYDCKTKFLNGEDDIFSSLVGGNPVAIFCADDNAEQPSHTDSDCDWEGVEGKNAIFPEHDQVELKSSVADEDNNDDSEVEWEEGDCDGANSTLFSGKLASRGRLEEESDLQEAIRRSLESAGNEKLKCMSSVDEPSNNYENKLDCGLEQGVDPKCSGLVDLNDNAKFLNNKNNIESSTICREDSTEQNKFHEIKDGDKKHDFVCGNNAQTSHFHGSHSKSSATLNSSNTEILINTPCRLDSHSYSEDSISDTNVMIKDQVPMVTEKLLDRHDDGNTSKVDSLGATQEEKKNYINESEPLSISADTTKSAIFLMDSSMKKSTDRLYIKPKLALDVNKGGFCEERNTSLGNDVVETIGDFPAHAAEVSLEEEMQILGQEYINLENEQRKLERNAESVNSELFTECQELLQMFGLPYIIAPMEAEAQCAYLEHEKLVDGVVTDDSDVLLFGARNVYKNIFDDRKYVETYFMEDIEKELGLTREKLVRMALLLGSDYTEGVSGIGIVNAIEVVNAFPEEDGLQKFRQWVESPDPTILGMLDAKGGGSNTRKKGSKVEEKIDPSNCDAKESASDQNISYAQEQNKLPDYIQEIKQTFINKHRNVSKNWHIPSSFPSETVISAYYLPHVDKSTDPFTWGKPDHLVLRKLCWEKFGWTGQKADELLLPVLKEYNKRQTQLRLEAFYSFNERFAKIRSKRIKKAVKGITGKQPSDLIDGSAEELSESRKIEREPKDSTLETSRGSLEGRRKSKIKQSRKRKNDGNSVAKVQSKKMKVNVDPSSTPCTYEMEKVQPSMQTEEEQSDGKALLQNRSGRGRGRGNGMGIKRGREAERLGFQSCETETSSGSSDIDDHGQRVHMDRVPKDVRRSMRSRKPVNYSFEDTEDEDADDSFDHKCNQTGPVEENLSHIHGACEGGATDSNIGKVCSTMNFSLKENLPTDSLESDLFCKDATETSHPVTGNLDSSDDYLQMGGGFCLDDSETGDKHNAIDEVNTAAVDYVADFSHCSKSSDETDCDRSSLDKVFSGTEKAENGIQGGVAFCKLNRETNDSCDHSDIGVLIPENVHNNSGASTGAFSAIPFLRKRRKK